MGQEKIRNEFGGTLKKTAIIYMFKDSKDGQTHYENDGCGIEEHNPTKKHSMKCPKLFGEDCRCDGYHTFDELYEHRFRLFIALAKMAAKNTFFYRRPTRSVWCSTTHSDGTSYQDWFILGIGKKPKHQITYHLPARFWEEVCEFAEILEKAPDYDGHTSDEVLERLKSHPDL